MVSLQATCPKCNGKIIVGGFRTRYDAERAIQEHIQKCIWRERWTKEGMAKKIVDHVIDRVRGHFWSGGYISDLDPGDPIGDKIRNELYAYILKIAEKED